MTRFIAIASAKGGVGKTTVALNLANALINFGYEVVLVDSNLLTPNISVHLGMPKLKVTLHDALKGKKHITETAYLHPSGLRIIPSDFSLYNVDDLNIDRLHETLKGLKDTAELIVLDTPAGLARETLHVLRSCHDLIAVTTPDILAVGDTLKTIRLAESYGVNILGVIINKTTGKKHELSEKNIETILEKPILGVIPYHVDIEKSLHLRNPLLYTHPDSEASVSFKKIAAKLIGQSYEKKLEKDESDGMFTYMLKRLGLK